MKKVSEITSPLTLQLALSEFFASKQLPDLAINHVSKTVYLTGPCGQTLCKVMYTGTTTLKKDDYPIIYDYVVKFITKHLKTLKLLFTLRKEVKEHNSNPNKRITLSGKTMFLNNTHEAYHKLINSCSETTVSIQGLSSITQKQFQELVSTLPQYLEKQREILKQELAIKDKELQAQKIIEQLSNCSI